METLHKLTIESLPQFILGGYADFIVSEIDSRDHINFKVKQDARDKHKFYVRYKSIDWIYIAYFQTDGENFRYMSQSTTIDGKLKSDIFRKLLLFIYFGRKVPSNLEILYSAQCSKCGRELKDPKYIEIGIGPTCLKKI